MYRARRLATVAVTAALAVTGLSACQTAPSVAAYVGHDTISEQRVTDVLQEVRANRLRPQQGQPPAAEITRENVLDVLVGRVVLRDLASRQNVQPTTDAAAVTQEKAAIGRDKLVSPQTEYVAAYTEILGLVNALGKVVKPAKITQADLRDVYRRLTAGQPASGGSFEQFASSLGEQDQRALALLFGVRNTLQPEITKVNARVNPQYQSPEVPLFITNGSFVTLVALELKEPTVVNAS